MLPAPFRCDVTVSERHDRALCDVTSHVDTCAPGEGTEVDYLVMTSCDFISVGNQFSRKPYALAVQKGSPLKDQLSEA